MLFDVTDENKEKSGIYEIFNVVNGKFYVGSTDNFRVRYNRHIAELRGDWHHSYHLQRSYNKYGANKFIFSVIEFCDIRDLKVREQFYLDETKPFLKDRGYNICPVAYSSRGVKRREESKQKLSASLIIAFNRPFEVVSLSGKVFKDMGMKGFCEKHNLSISKFCQMINGGIKHHKGWHLPGTDISNIVVLAPQPDFYHLKHESGEEVKIAKGELQKFCRDRNIKSPKFHRVWYENKIWHGWRRFDKKPEEVPVHRDIILLNPNKQEVIFNTKDNMAEFSRKNNIPHDGLGYLINKTRLVCGGWILKERRDEYYKYVNIISPTNEIITVLKGTLREVCRKLGINYYCMSDLTRGKTKNHKGYTLQKE